jgi:hypothetical protein
MSKYSYKLDDKVVYKGKEYIIVGLSKMVYDKDCDGESEWKITQYLKEVAIAQAVDESEDYNFQKPCWLSVSELEANKLVTTNQSQEKQG